MRKIYIPMMICLAAVLCSSSALAQISATVDRDQIALDETLTLTISKDGNSSISSAELQPLNKDFRILGKSQSSSIDIFHPSKSSFVLNLVLAPKQAGKLEIPALLIGKERTDSLYIKVVTMAQPKTKADSAPIYIETEVSGGTVFVQSELIFTLRIFWAVEASINDPADPQIQDVLIERLNDATFNKVVNGQTYQVFERKYAIFPQKSGKLEIPQIIVQATIPIRQRRGNRYDLFGARGKVVKLRSESEVITVREKSSAYPAGAEWLPTDKLTIVEDWSLPPEELRVGESVTIAIVVTAQGLLGEQLPPVELPATEGVKLYQGKAEVQNRIRADGVTGIRKESIALIPLRSGKVMLPPIRIPWWNKKQQKVEYAVLPARELLVKPALSAPGTTNQLPTAANNSEAPGASQGAMASYTLPTRFNTLLIGLCAFLGLAWLITVYLLLRTRQQLSTLKDGGRQELAAIAATNEREAFRTFGRACRSNDPARARKTVTDWARSFQPGGMVRSGADLAKAFPGSDLAVLLSEMDNILYNQGGDQAAWRGANLYESVENIRKTGAQKKKKEAALQELYK